MIVDAQHPARPGSIGGFGFEACFNFRDVGGYPSRFGDTVTTGRLYRSDSLHRMTPHDVALLSALGVRTVLDLRSAEERATVGSLRAPPSTLALRLVPMVDRAAAAAPLDVVPSLGERAERYLQMTRESAEVIGDGLTVLSDPACLPAVFHCAAGRDRTGVFAALVLMILGVADDDIVADYVLTQQTKAATDEWVDRHEPETLALWSCYPADLRMTYPQTMERYLSRFREEFGSVDQYLAAAGVQSAVADDLRFLLLD